ncbi:peptide ABC transporter permease [Bacillus sp. UMTAT18]|uniref:oligopeptide ABC transporter permease n=1 Tax=Bacillus TaxID=1386 RepID=UPI00061868FF|nr:MULTISPECIES: oligopeptide ABC transporter permease [Bacillus]KKC54449.1 peptide ABC transporter permease [Bacillus sp. UMTAT18]MDA1530538.1 ABC transporter permease [Bacillus cereus group sp. TH260-2LC]MDU2391772.1 ABC transporter permease [Bacillus sp. (in: firmicutes)]OJD70446.1 peptide ABC transporter permease [Bacillus sp. P14-1]
MMKDVQKLSPDLFQQANQNNVDNEVIARPSLTFWQDVRRRLFQHKGAMFGFILLALIILLAIFGPMVSKHSYKEQDLGRSKLPPKIPVIENVHWLPFDGTDQYGVDQYEKRDIKEYFWFGTDDLGRDLWTRTWEGTRVSLYIALLAAAIDLVIGVAYGGISAFYGGRVDNIMQRIMEIINGIPYLIIVILMVIIMGSGIWSITLAMAITGWIGMSRIVRGQILKLKNQEYVLASRTLGATNTQLIVKHLIPNVMGPIIVMTMFTIPSAVFGEAFLSFIGLGIQPPFASLGSLVNDGYKSIQTYPHMMFIPAVVISMLILAFNLMADGLRDALDPKMRK